MRGQIMKVPFNQPSLHGNEREYVLRAHETGETSSGGKYSDDATTILREELRAQEVLLTTSCTDALEMCSILCELGPGDLVICPSFTFVSTALAFARTGARILFCDIDPQTLAIDPVELDALLGPRVRAVLVVHYGGQPAKIDEIQSVLGSAPTVSLIEDNALGLFGTCDGTPLGSYGRFSTLSFHSTKPFSCGEGGALVLNDLNDLDRAQTILDKGTNRHEFLRGEVDKYTWVSPGSSFGMSDLLAAALLGQLEARESIIRLRRHIWHRYHAQLSEHSERMGLVLPPDLPGSDQNCCMYYTILADHPTRDNVLRNLNSVGVEATFHYMPLHRSPAGIAHSGAPSNCPVSDDISSRIVRLPFFNQMSDDQVDYVVEALLDSLS